MYFTRTILALLTISLIFILSGCDLNKTTEKPDPIASVVDAYGHTAGLPTLTYDDGKSTVYFKVKEPDWTKVDDGITQIMIAKRTWEDRNADKRVIAMTAITGDNGGYGHPMLVGLLIHYEPK